MMRALFNNTILSVLAFGVTSVLGILVAPLIIESWELAAYGILILVRIFLPAGIFSIADLGGLEIASLAVARARENGDWSGASRRVSFILLLVLAVSTALGGLLLATGDFWMDAFRVAAADREPISFLIVMTAVSLPFLFSGLVAEGVLRGFERFPIIRASEVVTAVGYFLGTAFVAGMDVPFAYVGAIYLASLMCRYATLAVKAFGLARRAGMRWMLPTERSLRSEVGHYAWIIFQSRLVGTIQVLSLPPLVGFLFGPAAAGIFDLIVRLPRFAKMSLSVLNASLLPVAARIDEIGKSAAKRRLGVVAFAILPAVTVPPIVAAAVFSQSILHLWVPSIAHLWPWMAVSFVVPVAAQYYAFAGAMMLTRPQVQRALNRVAWAQTLMMMVLAFALKDWLQEKGFILAQAVATAIFLPVQLRLIVSEFGLPGWDVGRFIAKQSLILAAGALAVTWLIGAAGIADLLLLLAAFLLWCALAWVVEYVVLLDPAQRGELAKMIRHAVNIPRLLKGLRRQ